MSEQLNSNRVIFPAGKQAEYLSDAKNKTTLTWPSFARSIGVHPRVINDWKREKYSLPQAIALKIQHLSGIDLPTGVEIRGQFWYTKIGGNVSGPLTYKKFGRVGGDPEHREIQWKKWWEESAHKNNLGIMAEQKDITMPPFSEKLAELGGIILGDGGLTARQLRITLDSVTDQKYMVFVASLIQELFDTVPTIIYRNSRAVDILVSRTKLITFWNERGIPYGNKTLRQADIPSWILGNKKFEMACLRGLMDTDGSIFNECHLMKNKRYCYPRLSFVNKSQNLLHSANRILLEAGFTPKLRSQRAVILEKREDVIRYFNEVGTHNPKHAARFVEFCS